MDCVLLERKGEEAKAAYYKAFIYGPWIFGWRGGNRGLQAEWKEWQPGKRGGVAESEFPTSLIVMTSRVSLSIARLFYTYSSLNLPVTWLINCTGPVSLSQRTSTTTLGTLTWPNPKHRPRPRRYLRPSRIVDRPRTQIQTLRNPFQL